MRGRHSLLVNDCPRLFASHVLDRLLNENVADIANRWFAIASERARIRHVAIPRRLDNLNSRWLMHVVFEMMSIGIEVNMIKVVD